MHSSLAFNMAFHSCSLPHMAISTLFALTQNRSLGIWTQTV